MLTTQEIMKSKIRFVLRQEGQHFNGQLFLKQNIKNEIMASIAVKFWKFFITFSKIMFFLIIAFNVSGLSITSSELFLYKNYLILLFYLAGLIIFIVVGLPLMVIMRILEKRKKQSQLKEKAERQRNGEDKITCSICMQELVVEQESIAIFPCMKQHIFHANCAYKWLKQSENCPLCRKQFKTNQDGKSEMELEEEELKKYI